MRFLIFLPWIAFGGLMILHGIAHAPGILGSWSLATFEDVSHQPNVLLTGAGEGMMLVLGGVWFLAALSFVIAGIGVLRQTIWWPMAASVALVLSIGVTILWQHDAAIGLMLNGVILGIMGIMYLLAQREQHRIA